MTTLRPQLEDTPHFFIDRNLCDDELVAALRAFEFRVTSHFEHYTEDRVPDPQAVSDPDIISECASRGWAIITADARMEYAHFTTIRKHPIAILIVPDNKQKPTKWAKSLLDSRPVVYRFLANCRLPLVGRINTPGKLYQLRCIKPDDSCPQDCALLINNGKINHEIARQYRKKAG